MLRLDNMASQLDKVKQVHAADRDVAAQTQEGPVAVVIGGQRGLARDEGRAASSPVAYSALSRASCSFSAGPRGARACGGPPRADPATGPPAGRPAFLCAKGGARRCLTPRCACLYDVARPRPRLPSPPSASWRPRLRSCKSSWRARPPSWRQRRPSWSRSQRRPLMPPCARWPCAPTSASRSHRRRCGWPPRRPRQLTSRPTWPRSSSSAPTSPRRRLHARQVRLRSRVPRRPPRLPSTFPRPYPHPPPPSPPRAFSHPPLVFPPPSPRLPSTLPTPFTPSGSIPCTQRKPSCGAR